MKDYPHMPGWRLNKNDNKPAIKHSILMLTTHGVAEGEWDGNEWIQYRWSAKVKDSDVYYWLCLEDLTQLEKEGDSLQQEQPKPYFYCKYGGTIPLCSDCKRNHNNSSFKTKEITTWYAPSNGTKHCADYIQKEQPEIDLEKEVENFCLEYDSRKEVWFDMTPRDKKMLSIPTWSNFAANIAHHFYELGKLNMRKDVISNNKSSLLSNLDEVAEEYANKEYPDEPCVGRWGTGDYEPPVDNEYPREIAKDAFKAGAKWMTEQG